MGFLPHDGVFEHSFVLQGRFNDPRIGGWELCMGFIDFANAFGPVAHQALVDTVRGAGAGQALANVVEDLYHVNTTCVVEQHQRIRCAFSLRHYRHQLK